MHPSAPLTNANISHPPSVNIETGIGILLVLTSPRSSVIPITGFGALGNSSSVLLVDFCWSFSVVDWLFDKSCKPFFSSFSLRPDLVASVCGSVVSPFFTRFTLWSSVPEPRQLLRWAVGKLGQNHSLGAGRSRTVVRDCIAGSDDNILLNDIMISS